MRHLIPSFNHTDTLLAVSGYLSLCPYAALYWLNLSVHLPDTRAHVLACVLMQYDFLQVFFLPLRYSYGISYDRGRYVTRI